MRHSAKPFILTLVSVSDSGLRYLAEELDSLYADAVFGTRLQEQLQVCMHYVGEHASAFGKAARIEADLHTSDLVLLDLMGAPAAVTAVCETAAETISGDLVLLGAGSNALRARMKLRRFSLKALMNKMMKLMPARTSGDDSRSARVPDMEKMLTRLETLGRVLPIGPLKDMRNWLLCSKYWRFAGPENIRNLLLLLGRQYGGCGFLPKPGPLVDYSRSVLFDPATLVGFDNLEALQHAWGWHADRLTVGLLFYNFNYPNYAVGVLAHIVDRLRKHYNVVPLGVASDSNRFAKIQRLLDEGLTLDLLWNFLPFRFGAGPMGGNPEDGLNIFRRLNVPVLHPMLLGKRKRTDWERSVKGLSPMEVLIYVILPELDGVIESLPVAALTPRPTSRIGDLQELEILPGRLNKLLARSANYLQLRRKAPADRRIALILYNYPPGEGQVGRGAFLDTFASVERITAALRGAGYDCPVVAAEQLEAVFMQGGVCNSAQWHLPNAVTERLPLDHYMNRYANRNLNPELNPELNPNWAPEAFHQQQMDRISATWGDPPGTIMIDTGGFLIPGIHLQNLFIGLQPSRGVYEDTAKQYHDQELPPHHQYAAFYRWLEEEFKADAVVHVGTHGTLEFLPGKESGMSDTCFSDYLIGAMPHFYLYYSGNPAEAVIAKRRTHASLISYAGPPLQRAGLYGDALALDDLLQEYTEAQSLAPQKLAYLEAQIQTAAQTMHLQLEAPLTVEAVADELLRLKTSLMPVGLHIIGAPFPPAAKAGFLSAMLAWERGPIRALPALIQDIWPQVAPLQPVASDASTEPVQQFTEALIQDWYWGARTLTEAVLQRVQEPARKALQETLAFGETCLARIRQTDELAGLLKALNGEYLEARLGGDLMRDPKVFPTGGNLVQFDPRRVPSATAMARGGEIAASTLAHYRRHHNGAYPQSVAVVLWGLETSRTRGETVGQIMAYLGVRLKTAVAGIEKHCEIIPLSELQRPRIDCVITICGFFRDMYPNLIDMLDAAFDQVADLDEPEDQNYVRAHCHQQALKLANQMDAASARTLARARIFGPAEGEYGTGLTNIIGSGNWHTEAELAAVYLTSQQHIYTRSRRGEPQEALLRDTLRHVELVSQVRSSVDYTFADLDHYYEFFGGLARSVETVRGQKPALLVTDSAERRMFTEDAAKAVAMGVRSRLLNPAWIEALLHHKVHGAQQISQRVENLVGLAATTGDVASWMFDAVKKTYIDDVDIWRQLQQNNPFAASEMLLRLLEAAKRGYWQATADDIDSLQAQYMELEGEIEEAVDMNL